MSYIVPGDIPNNCGECPCGYITEGAFSDECQVLAREWEKDADSVRPNWCPLIEIKTPHGRLIDADALIADLVKYQNTLDPESRENARVLSIKSFLTLARGEAIIEAEEGE